MTTPGTPMDLMGVYLSPVVGVGQRLTPDSIDRELAKMPLLPTLILLSQINFRADTVDAGSNRAVFARFLLPPSIAERAIALIESDSRYQVVSSQVVTRLALKALVLCSGDSSTSTPRDLPQRIGSLLLSYAGIIEQESDEDSDIVLELVRLELWFRLRDYDRWYEVSHRLIFEVLPTLIDHPDWIDSRSILEEAVGIDLNLFWALTTTMGVAVANDPDPYRFPKYTDSDHVDNSEIDRWQRFWTTSLSDARSTATSDLGVGLWVFNTFYNKPLLELGTGTSIAVRPWFLANKATPTGYYSAIETLLGDDRALTARWSRLFGQAIDRFGRILIAEYCSDIEQLSDEDAIRASWGDGLACDAVLLGIDWLAIDFVHRRISRDTATTGDFTALAPIIHASA